ncbi:TrkH family potassium uptake protein [Oleispirillum naphthae]|uniref:TrkH family potassium uptake protein n=1 Tax=Oleispirillum naphthae TaxID=2838853 RepID=UPI00308234FF
MSFASLQFVFYAVGFLLNLIAAAMAVPAAVDYFDGNPDWRVFLASMAVTFYVGLSLMEANRNATRRMSVRTGFLLTTLGWVVVTAFAALPLAFCSLHIGFTNAFFEAMSGLTTTGSTVLTGLDDMAPGLLLWRSMLQGIGGLGIIAMAMIMMPFLRVGGMQLFHSESSDISERPVPRAFHVVGITALVYCGLILACAVALVAAGMPLFDAVNHAMAAIATGGFSTKDASVGYFRSVPIEAVLIVFMTLGALPLVFYARLAMNWRRALSRERQVPTFLAVLGVAILAVAALRWHTGHVPFAAALRQAAFNVTSVLTDTGFATADYGAWGEWAVAAFMLLMFIGGCAGSTAGAIKIFRWQILFRGMVDQMRRALSPHRVAVVRHEGHVVDEGTIGSVRNFFFMYLLTWAGLTTACMVSGMDYLSATSGVAQAMANAGPGLGELIGPAGNFREIPDAAKWVLSAAMLLGRLELTTVYVLLTMAFWRD